MIESPGTAELHDEDGTGFGVGKDLHLNSFCITSVLQARATWILASIFSFIKCGWIISPTSQEGWRVLRVWPHLASVTSGTHKCLIGVHCGYYIKRQQKTLKEGCRPLQPSRNLSPEGSSSFVSYGKQTAKPLPTYYSQRHSLADHQILLDPHSNP
jgi:hypothetical protein